MLRIGTRLSVLVGVLATCLAGAAGAQVLSNPLRPSQAVETPCVLDKCLKGPSGPAPEAAPTTAPPASTAAGSPARPDRVQRIGPLAPGSFDFYLLALSWSPGFCDTGGDAKAPQQCADGARLGFVVHGLWPQNQHGFPSDCDSTARSPSRLALDSVTGLYPDVGLARYEWRKHGTCTGLSPTDYFAAVRRAREAVAVPDSLTSLAEPQTMAPLDLVRAFAGSNPGLRADMMAVTCRQGELEEVRICFSKDLRGFVSCPEVSRATCRTREITVMPVR